MSQKPTCARLMRQMTARNAFGLLKQTASSWNKLNAPSLGASLAYYALLSLAPVILLVVGMIGLFLPQSTVEHDLLSQARQLAGDSAANTLQTVLNSPQQKTGGLLASAVAIITLFIGASGVFGELQTSLNTIWEAKVSSGGVRNLLVQRLATFAMVLVLGLLLLLSLLVSAMLSVGVRYFGKILPAGTAAATEIVNAVGSFLAISVLFGLIFKFVPNVALGWRDVGIGAMFTAILFTIGRALLAFYLATAGVGSTYGAAGSLVALVVWVYYSAQIFFFGAVFTRVYADEKALKNPQNMPVAIK